MGDIICRRCDEPWDAYGVKHGDMTFDEAKRFLRGEGCPACGFGHICTHCNGSGKEPADQWGHDDCPECFGKRQILVRRCQKAADPFYHDWYFGYRPTVRRGPAPCRRLPDGQCLEGRVEAGWAYCPLCWEDADACLVCGGDGKFHPSRDGRRILDRFIFSLCEETDEDPVALLSQVVA